MRHVARLLLPSIRWDTTHGLAGVRPFIERAAGLGVGGFVLERAPVGVLVELAHIVRAQADEAPLLVVDPFAPRPFGDDAPDALPPLAALASLRDVLVIRRAARAAARGVRRLGCNTMLAPSCDVAAPPRTDAFGPDASLAAIAIAEWIDAAQAEGVLCIAGEFPGAGRSSGRPPVARIPEDVLYAEDLVPFRAAIDAGVAAVSVGASRYPAMGRADVPAALSSDVVSRMLRSELLFDGLVVADAVAVDAAMGRAVGTTPLVAAGVDLVLRPSHLDVEVRALMDAVGAGSIDREHVIGASRRRRDRAEVAGPPQSLGLDDDDRGWLEEVAERTISVARGRAVRVSAPVEVAVVGDAANRDAIVSALARGVGEAGGDPAGVRHAAMPSPAGRTAFVVVVVPADPRAVQDTTARIRVPDRIGAICAEAHRLRRDAALIWCGHPASVPAADADLVVACWSPSEPMIRAAGRWLVRRV